MRGSVCGLSLIHISLDVTAGDAFDSGDITVNGILVQLPMSYSDFKALGFSIDSEDEEYVSNKNEYYYPTFYDAQGNELGEVYIGNVTDDPQTLADGTVFGFSFTSMYYHDAVSYTHLGKSALHCKNQINGAPALFYGSGAEG